MSFEDGQLLVGDEGPDSNLPLVGAVVGVEVEAAAVVVAVVAHETFLE